ncbi:aldo/keto reductase [Butyrivibrio sp. VCD2006]|uniref:aldo/keto reductase n=1 Tax=Butyrivibrio sp. VCD2006 TaxID=1280664 RepID=UPI00041A24E4|nr:aldo/keto reductase [Butyrivibrio sp. VCD2006]
MKYRKNKLGEDLSLLGYGCMRFTKSGAGIDMEKAEKEIMRAYELGVNYYDTAYIYSGSEVAIGEIFEKNHIREKINIATKLPQYLIANKDAIEKYFKEQLSRLRTSYIDYYLMHMLSDIEAWNKLKKLGIEEWIAEKKASGEIRQIGFSFHGNSEMFIEILNAYDWDFCQIQYNYLDEVSQAGRKGLMAAGEKGIPVIIMEPLRGGKLVDLLPDKAKKMIAQDEKHRTAPELAFRWLWDQPQVTVVLSGMNSIPMVEENCRVASEVEAGEFTEKDFELIENIKNSINETLKVGCTGCGYCMPCPRGVDIPSAFRCYNAMYMDDKRSGRWEYMRMVGMRKTPALPSQCVACGKCESHCPQHIHIIEELKNADRALRPLPYRILTVAARKFLYRK